MMTMPPVAGEVSGRSSIAPATRRLLRGVAGTAVAIALVLPLVGTAEEVTTFKASGAADALGTIEASFLFLGLAVPGNFPPLTYFFVNVSILIVICCSDEIVRMNFQI